MKSAPKPSAQMPQVWCDVGGTFTDCFLTLGDGTQSYIKVLSTGIVKGHVEQWVDQFSFVDRSRSAEPDGFWVGASVAWIDSDGVQIGTERCKTFDSVRGELQLEQDGLQSWPRSRCVRYELSCGLEAPVLATRLLLRCNPSNALPPLHVRLGTTRGTNALLTRTGQPCALVTTRGFADLLKIGYQERPELFALSVRKRKPLHHCVVEIDERLAADGSVLQPIDMQQAEQALRQLYDSGIHSIAICLLHSYCNPAHETMLQQLAEEIGFECICVSHQAAPRIKAVMRAETTLVDAYLTPVVQGYLQRVAQQFSLSDRTHFRVMTSGGGLVSSEAYRGKDSVLSGPAGGAVAIEAYAIAMGLSRCIGLDMGGTSTDVCRVDGSLQLEDETIKAGVRMMVPTLAIHTVAAGGGSVCWFDGVQLRVGPQSAGANPGPACYGRGGPLTVTDLNLLTGRIDLATFPFSLDKKAAQHRLDEILQSFNTALGSSSQHMTGTKLLDGFRRIANEHMAAAVRSISVAQGADPREHALLGFGGAAGQHICEIAELLGIQKIIDPPQAGLLSALGMGMASVKRMFTKPIYQHLAQIKLAYLAQLQSEMRDAAAKEFVAEGIDFHQVTESSDIELRYAGTEGSLIVSIDLNSLGHEDKLERFCIEQFNRLHLQRFGYLRSGKPIEAVSLQSKFVAASENQLPRIETVTTPDRVITAESNGSDRFVILREQLIPGQRILGPALIVSGGSTTSVEPNWAASVLSDRTLMLSYVPSRNASDSLKNCGLVNVAETQSVDPVLREVLAQRIAAIADQMGIVLEQTAISVNVKDRRDFSCAVFAANGDLIANAPHVPVHLGAMSQTIRCVMKVFPSMQPGDCFVTNDPYQGGSHLPDITVITPVFARNEQAIGPPDFFVACRAHHAEIGGIAPGSMAPTSKRLGEEGVVIPPMYLVKQNEDRSEDVERLLRNATYPSRSVLENMADLSAQQAANQRGSQAMTELAEHYGIDVVTTYLEHIQAASETKTRAWIASLGSETRTFKDQMDDGTAICVQLTPTRNQQGQPTLEIDFDGTGPVSAGNLNANPAIVSAAVIYVIRCALDDSLPLNSGVLRCVELKIPSGILNPAVYGEQSDWPAVAGGNVETSQRVVDCLLGALGLAAASQGTMNNFLFGDSSFGYYETIGGGTGATRECNGEDAVHSHMTNTRLTDVEILEKRYPVRLVRFEIRKGSGGQGKTAGGNGIIRQVQALRPLDVSLVTSRRSCAPFGLAGGANGKPGENWLIEQDGHRTQLGSAVQLSIGTGDSILIETPGGGGFGAE